VKALKLLVGDLEGDGGMAAVQPGDLASDDGNSDWADSDVGEEKLIHGFKPDEYAYLSEILGGKGGPLDEDDDGLEGGLDDEDLKQDDIYTMDIKSHLASFMRECAQQDPNGFSALVDRLNAQEILFVRNVVGGN